MMQTLFQYRSYSQLNSPWDDDIEMSMVYQNPDLSDNQGYFISTSSDSSAHYDEEEKSSSDLDYSEPMEIDLEGEYSIIFTESADDTSEESWDEDSLYDNDDEVSDVEKDDQRDDDTWEEEMEVDEDEYMPVTELVYKSDDFKKCIFCNLETKEHDSICRSCAEWE